jgi:hypothetical protein
VGDRKSNATGKELNVENGYKRFWTNLFHRNVWQDPSYLVRKSAALRQDTRRRNYVYHRRDLMPKCVLVLVRSWFPNPPYVPYMGHMWE